MFSPFICPKEAVVGRKFEQKEYITYKIVESAIVKDPKHPEEFTIERKVVEDERIPIREELNSYKSKVGLKNLLKGITTKKQMSEFVEKTSSNGEFVDLTKMPTNFDEFVQLSKSVDRIWESLPKELRKDMTKEEFVRKLTREQINDYVISEAKKRQPKKEPEKKKEEVK